MADRSVLRGLAVLVVVLALAPPRLAPAAPREGGGEGTVPAAAQRELPPGLVVPEAARPGPGFDPDRATSAYLAVLSDEQRRQSDAYYEGGYWLELWLLVYTLGTAALLLLTGWSRRMRELAERVTRRPLLVTALYAGQWTVVMFLLSLPMGTYANFLREHAYGLSNQTYLAWLWDDTKELFVELVLLPPLLALVYWAVQRTGRRWWVWTVGISVAATALIGVIAPIWIAPLFNRYVPLPPSQIREQVLSLARANQIPAGDVFLVDESRQTTQVSANVSGLFGTTRIALNDNLLNRSSAPEIRVVMAHEMAHYVLSHGPRFVLYFGIVMGFALWALAGAFDAVLARWGRRLGIAGRGDPAGLPLAMALLAIFFTVITPVTNGIVRQAESEADAFAINAAGEPHGFATAALRLSTYRKLAPGAVERAIFYDHPSGYDRIHRAMTWLAEHQDDPRVLASLAATNAAPGG